MNSSLPCFSLYKLGGAKFEKLFRRYEWTCKECLCCWQVYSSSVQTLWKYARKPRRCIRICLALRGLCMSENKRGASRETSQATSTRSRPLLKRTFKRRSLNTPTALAVLEDRTCGWS